MKNVALIVKKYWLNTKSVRRSFDDKGAVIGLSFKDIEYGSLLLDEDLKAIMLANESTSELNFRHGTKGSTFKKDKETFIIKKDFFYVGLDSRASYDDVDDLFIAQPVSK